MLSFSCTGLPVGMTCNFNPAQINIADGGERHHIVHDFEQRGADGRIIAAERNWNPVVTTIPPVSMADPRRTPLHTRDVVPSTAIGNLSRMPGWVWRWRQAAISATTSGDRLENRPGECEQRLLYKDDSTRPQHSITIEFKQKGEPS